MNEIPIFKFALRDDLKDSKEFLPSKAHETDTGYDVRAAQSDRKNIIIKPYEYFKIPLGFRVRPDNGWWFQIFPRSSSFIKKHIHALYGVVDEGFPLETHFVGQYQPNK